MPFSTLIILWETTKLNLRFLLLAILLSIGSSAHAAERFLMDFEFTAGDKIIDRGKAIVSQKKYTWSKGIERSFLKLSCRQNRSGKMEKVFSTVDYFTGLKVTHQLVGKNLELNVMRNVVQPRLTEIRALPKGECQELSPLVTTTTKTYHFPAKHGANESRPFDDHTTFKARFQSTGGTL